MNASAIATAVFFRWQAVEGEFDDPLRLHEARVSRIGEDSLIVVGFERMRQATGALVHCPQPDEVAFVGIRGNGQSAYARGTNDRSACWPDVELFAPAPEPHPRERDLRCQDACGRADSSSSAGAAQFLLRDARIVTPRIWTRMGRVLRAAANFWRA
jgi:hypothetical protein